MRYRNIRKIATGEWVNCLSTTTKASFSRPDDGHIARIAEALSLNPNELEAVDGDFDARTGTLINPPVVAPTPTRKEELMAIGKDNWTDAQQKELIELLAGE
jgi:hypothetical protein